MLVRVEKVYKTTDYLVIDEIDTYYGIISRDNFEHCVIDNTISVEIDEYTFYHVHKHILLKLLSDGK